MESEHSIFKYKDHYFLVKMNKDKCIFSAINNIDPYYEFPLHILREASYYFESDQFNRKIENGPNIATEFKMLQLIDRTISFEIENNDIICFSILILDSIHIKIYESHNCKVISNDLLTFKSAVRNRILKTANYLYENKNKIEKFYKKLLNINNTFYKNYKSITLDINKFEETKNIFENDDLNKILDNYENVINFANNYDEELFRNIAKEFYSIPFIKNIITNIESNSTFKNITKKKIKMPEKILISRSNNSIINIGNNIKMFYNKDQFVKNGIHYFIIPKVEYDKILNFKPNFSKYHIPYSDKSANILLKNAYSGNKKLIINRDKSKIDILETTIYDPSDKRRYFLKIYEKTKYIQNKSIQKIYFSVRHNLKYMSIQSIESDELLIFSNIDATKNELQQNINNVINFFSNLKFDPFDPLYVCHEEFLDNIFYTPNINTTLIKDQEKVTSIMELFDNYNHNIKYFKPNIRLLLDVLSVLNEILFRKIDVKLIFTGPPNKFKDSLIEQLRQYGKNEYNRILEKRLLTMYLAYEKLPDNLLYKFNDLKLIK